MGIRLRNDWVYYALFQYFWILVILPKAVQLLALGAFACLMWFRSGSEKQLDKFSILQLLFMLIYGVSIVVNAIRGGHEMSRILAAINTWLITAVALLFYHLYSYAPIDLNRLGKKALFNLIILSLLWIIYTVTRGNNAFAVMGHSLSGPDWVNGLYAPRFLGYMDYANLVVFCILFFYPLALFSIRGKTIITFILTAVLFLVVKSTNSRTGTVLYLLVFLAYFLFEMQKQFFTFYKQRKFALLGLMFIMALCVVVFGFSYILKIFTSFMEMREGSNSMRTAIYLTSLQTMWQNSPVIGIGIKDMLGEYPLGSHSTYIGVFYKAGILGGSLYIISILYTDIKAISTNNNSRHFITIKICILTITLLMALEDIDGANWCICIFFALLAIFQSHEKRIEKEN